MNTFEEHIVNWIAKEAEGKLIIYNPEGKDGVDLIVKKRASYNTSSLNIKVKSTNKKEDDIFTIDVSKEDFNPQDNLYLIFAYFDSVERKINEYIWIIPSLEFNKIAEKKESVLRFQSSLNNKKKDKYFPFLINKEEIASILLEIAKNPENFQFSNIVTLESKKIDKEILERFITEARENTYAVSAKELDNPRLSGSKQLEYQKSNFFYIDVYFSGNLNFIGQETIYQNNKPIWCMGYMGNNDMSKETVFFLKKSLLHLSSKCRLGKKCDFRDGNYFYQDEGEGSLENFKGEEIISESNKQVYQLKYMGGLLSKEK